MDLYRSISGREYSLEYEHSPFDLEIAKRSPFPYQTHSPSVVGEQLLAIGFLLRHFPMKPPAHVVEFGAGWGGTTLELLRLGYRVTVVEVDPGFCELIQHRCRDYADQLAVVHSDMLSFTSDRAFDVALFFESFHHCADHVRMLRQVHESLAPGGYVVLAAEPMEHGQGWGLRLDGGSLYSIHKYGWLELGFSPRYMTDLLQSLSFSIERFLEPALGSIADVWVATRGA